MEGRDETDIPSGLPDEDHEHTPLGPEQTDAPAPAGPEAMPGIPENGEADTAG